MTSASAPGSAVTGRCGFFLQAEDGIRYVAVTGVQTCALPISRQRLADKPELGHWNRFQPDLVPGETDRARADRGAELPVDCEERLAHDLERRRARHAPPPEDRKRVV